ncbi:hypothetical protein CC85DRAFT_267281 [Cutaneotrichosporon oleaginosum]|uniref:A to I editase domain-containing protein n=1 Tax=Cutaneotrichosporon oleaginosum TaxID=879819 RepID=A0A0J0XBC5_9TREE|nr:uncharacterized protein CC85DRAFT_267281 [Cutaneotrichosporon oleaginosum]KLT38368.1 hypothetical protein CC85DRAFT_267281 [Cutaneotrichosporon oleaginosum]TXT07566.1 hypothetical protein COLE_04490 [Cutaneotrichosporon oleaginosum]
MTPDMVPEPEDVVHAALETYARLPKHGKPTVRDNGVKEWTVFASVVLTSPTTSPRVASIGAGVKCLPANRLPPLGDTVHDSHAEVLARRGFVRFLLSEAATLLAGQESAVLSQPSPGKFALLPDVEVWLYISALPCGDSSTLHTAAHQDATEAASFASLEASLSAVEGAARGRSGYANLGAIRTKPGRRDAPASISFSCSDKIGTWCALGLQGALLERFAPVYLDHIVVGGVQAPSTEGEGWREGIRREVERAVYGRLEGIGGALPPPYALHRPRVHLTDVRFPFDKPSGDSATANTSLSFVAGCKPEVLVNGCVQTSGWKAPGRTLLKDKLRSRVCRIEIMRAYLALANALPDASGNGGGSESTYDALKAHNTAYAAAKRVIRGEPRDPVGPEWNLPHDFQATTGDAPFTGWIVAGKRYASFTAEGEARD